MTGDERTDGPSGRHADLDTLADLHAGVLEGAEAAKVREHAAGCRQCAQTLEALDTVRGELRSLPTPAMPAAVAARLDATLADLRVDRSASTVPAEPPGPPDPEDELAAARARRSRRLSRTIGAAAAAVVLLAGGGAIASIVRGDGSATTTSSAGSAARAPAQPEQQSGGSKSNGGSFGTDVGGGPAGTVPVLPAYDQASLRAALPSIAAPGGARLAGMNDPARQAACAEGIPGTTGSLRAVEHISYRGQPAYVFVYGEGARLTGYVVTETCGSAPGQRATVIATVS